MSLKYSRRFHESNREIVDRGETVFEENKFIGNPCKKCGNTIRLISNLACIYCQKQRAVVFSKKHRIIWRSIFPLKTRVDPADKRYKERCLLAAKKGYAPPPHEKDCSPYPEDSRCQLCSRLNPGGHKLCLEHDHVTGQFRGWVCRICNSTISNAENIGFEYFSWFVKGQVDFFYAYPFPEGHISGDMFRRAGFTLPGDGS